MDYSLMEQYWIWLGSVEGIGVKTFYQLLAEFSDARTVWENVRETEAVIGNRRTYAALMAAHSQQYFYQLFAELEKRQVTAVTRLHDDYPRTLTDIDDPPPTLYVRGNRDLNPARALAVVGSRRATPEGRKTALAFSAEMARAAVTIISGLARGIDTFAHTGCLDGGGRTVAVLGCGADVVYPPENDALYRRILENGGSIVSEYAPGTPPLAQNFPARNRIISGMSLGVLLVEGTKKSGAMITANYAAEQGRDVFAVPGSIYSPLSEAPNRLILQGAQPVLSAWDILESFRWGERPAEGSLQHRPLDLDENEKIIVEAIRESSLSFDEIVNCTEFSVAKLNSLLTTLELRGIIEKEAGGYYRFYERN